MSDAEDETRAAAWGERVALDQLKQLRDVFQDIDLTQVEFVERLQGVLVGVTANELTHLFMKIDVNSDGTVSWDEFVAFLFLNKQRVASGHGEHKKVLDHYLDAPFCHEQHNAIGTDAQFRMATTCSMREFIL